MHQPNLHAQMDGWGVSLEILQQLSMVGASGFLHGHDIRIAAFMPA
jgi:hypothetical protein